MNIDPQVLIDKLNGMSSADEIAKFLRAEGITGDAGSMSSCVLAEYFKRELGTPYVRVSAFSVDIDNR